MTNVEFVKMLTDGLAKSPKKYLPGLPSAVIARLKGRKDVFSKIANVVLHSKKAGAGLNALKLGDFGVFGFKNFPEFNLGARTKVEEFIDSLSPEDAESFSNDENILVICVQPDPEVVEDTEAQIATGKSYVLGFNNAVRKEFKDNMAIYIMVMWAPSIANFSSLKKMVTTSTPSKNVMRMIEKNDAKIAYLEGRKANYQQTMAEYGNVQDMVGGQFYDYNALLDVDKSYADKFDRDVKARIKALSKVDKNTLRSYRELMEKGREVEARKFLKMLSDQTLASMLANGRPQGLTEKINNSRADLKKKIRDLNKKNMDILNDMGKIYNGEVEGSARDITVLKWRMKKNDDKIRTLRNRLEAYGSGMSAAAKNRKAEVLASVNNKIEELVRKGTDLRSSLEIALDESPISPAEKEVIAQQVVSELANGAPLQYAVQQAVQDNIKRKRGGRRKNLTGTQDLENMVMNGLI